MRVHFFSVNLFLGTAAAALVTVSFAVTELPQWQSLMLAYKLKVELRCCRLLLMLACSFASSLFMQTGICIALFMIIICDVVLECKLMSQLQSAPLTLKFCALSPSL